MAVVTNNENAIQQGQQKAKKQQLAIWTRGIRELDYTLL
jgi:succinate dehydrogenase flavin-adding protein (antitoxin of CptAB toxin-antitoxin module)